MIHCLTSLAYDSGFGRVLEGWRCRRGKRPGICQRNGRASVFADVVKDVAPVVPQADGSVTKVIFFRCITDGVRAYLHDLIMQVIAIEEFRPRVSSMRFNKKLEQVASVWILI